MPNIDPVTFGRYLLDAKLATGGMGEIFLARMKGPAGFEKKVVIKRILPQLAQSDEFVERFKDEGRLVVQLNHSNIVQIFEMGEERGQYYLAMEYVDGVDLRTVLHQLKRMGQNVVPLEIVIHILVEVAKGLAHAHSRTNDKNEKLGIIHRDVSPSNVMISREGEVKLLDFGIAKAEGQMVNSISGSLHGKFLYMSPEQAGGKSLDNRSDLFSLGSCAYEMLSGQRPFVGNNEIETLELIRNVECQPLGTLCPDLPTEVVDIIERCMAQNSTARYNSADELQRALVNYLMESRQIVTNSDVAGFIQPHVGTGAMAQPKSIDEALNMQIDALIGQPDSLEQGTQLAGESLAFGDTSSAIQITSDTSTTGRRTVPVSESDLPKASRNRILLASLILVVGILVTLNLVTLGELHKRNDIRPVAEQIQPTATETEAQKVTQAGPKQAAKPQAAKPQTSQDSIAVAKPSPPAAMKLRIRDLPADARIQIDGQSTIADKDGNYFVPSGTGDIKLLINAPGRKIVERSVKRAAGVLVEITAQLELLMKTVLIKTQAGATILVNGKMVGSGTYRAKVQPDKEVSGKIMLAGYQTRSFTATYDSGPSIHIKLKKRSTGTLEIRVLPANAEIRIDGKIVKKSSQQVNRLKISVAPGEHRLIANAPNSSQTVSRRFTIKSGQTKRLSQINLVD
ncbi:MAG TPA: serine/threonine protein kinase [Myxococcales bacterium]|nr:serine/threonine protein kinase [Myxococcales bacterium]HIN86865.1 serine/threonine protein kinase [Myxococcales bacterium]